MFGSEVLEVAIGLVLMFFTIALAASGLVEIVSRWMGKRATDLQEAISSLIEPQGDFDIQKSSIWAALVGGAEASFIKRKPKGPSYMSSRDFADAVVELLRVAKSGAKTADEMIDKLPPMLRKRLRGIVTDTEQDLTALKAGLEQWFDAAMTRLEGAYKRWATFVLFFVGLGLAVAANASAFHVAADLWSDSAVRDAVLVAATEQADTDGATIASIEEAVDAVDATHLPLGWSDEARAAFADFDVLFILASAGGWIITALLVMLGAPFWYDLLTRLVALRSTGRKPEPAERDALSATRALDPMAAFQVPGAVTLNAPASFEAMLRRSAPKAPSAATWEADLFGVLGGVQENNGE